MNKIKGISDRKARMKDGSGNPFMQRSENKRLLHLADIFYWSSVNFVCSKQPDAAVTQGKLGHAQKKSLLKFQKGSVYFMS